MKRKFLQFGWFLQLKLWSFLRIFFFFRAEIIWGSIFSFSSFTTAGNFRFLPPLSSHELLNFTENKKLHEVKTFGKIQKIYNWDVHVNWFKNIKTKQTLIWFTTFNYNSTEFINFYFRYYFFFKSKERVPRLSEKQDLYFSIEIFDLIV